MAVRPHYPSAAAKQAAYRLRKRQAARDLATQECAAIQQALQTRALADQCWELHELIDDSSQDADMS
jgi:DNA-binding transcriptional regulator PaaX